MENITLSVIYVCSMIVSCNFVVWCGQLIWRIPSFPISSYIQTDHNFNMPYNEQKSVLWLFSISRVNSLVGRYSHDYRYFVVWCGQLIWRIPSFPISSDIQTDHNFYMPYNEQKSVLWLFSISRVNSLVGRYSHDYRCIKSKKYISYKINLVLLSIRIPIYISISSLLFNRKNMSF